MPRTSTTTTTRISTSVKARFGESKGRRGQSKVQSPKSKVACFRDGVQFAGGRFAHRWDSRRGRLAIVSTSVDPRFEVIPGPIQSNFGLWTLDFGLPSRLRLHLPRLRGDPP